MFGDVSGRCLTRHADILRWILSDHGTVSLNGPRITSNIQTVQRGHRYHREVDIILLTEDYEATGFGPLQNGMQRHERYKSPVRKVLKISSTSRHSGATMATKMLRSLTVFGALSTALAAPSTRLCGPQYDYIVVGGGTSGLVVANRLSENPNVSVLIIEAGGSVLNNSNVTDVNGYGLAFGTDIDWQYETINQSYAGDAPQVLRAGKALSGTSAINGMSCVHVWMEQALTP